MSIFWCTSWVNVDVSINFVLGRDWLMKENWVLASFAFLVQTLFISCKSILFLWNSSIPREIFLILVNVNQIPSVIVFGVIEKRLKPSWILWSVSLSIHASLFVVFFIRPKSDLIVWPCPWVSLSVLLFEFKLLYLDGWISLKYYINLSKLVNGFL